MTHDSNAPFSISPIQLSVRCFAERKGNQWQAFSIEFGLAAQDETISGVKTKLDEMIACYWDDIFGEDREHAWELFHRKAPLTIRAKYFVVSNLLRFVNAKEKPSRVTFNETLPISLPAGCAA